MSKSTAKSTAAAALAASHGTTSAASGASEKPVTKPARKSTPKSAQTALALIAPAAAPVADDASFDPTYTVGGLALTADRLVVGMMGSCAADAVFVPPQGHARHDPRAMTARSPEFDGDIAARGLDQPIAVYVLDGRVEVLDGRGRLAACAAAKRDALFVVRDAPTDALHARMGANRLNTLRLAPDPVAQGLLAAEALDAGLSVDDVAAAMGVPVSTVRAQVRVATTGDDATKGLLADGVIDASSALVLTQQSPEVREEVIAGVESLVAAAVAEGAKVAPVTGSQKGDAKPDAKSKRGATVTRNAVEALRDAAKGREVATGGKDGAKAGTAAKPEKDGIARPDPKRDVLAERDLRLARIRRNALATLASGNATAVERAYAQGLLDAVAVAYTGDGVTPAAGHPAPALAVALVRMPAGHEASGERLARIVTQ